MEKIKKNRIGILGGMGPDASAFFYKLLLEKSRTDYGAINNEDYPDIILHSVPVPDFISDQKNVSKAFIMLKDSTLLIAPKCSIICIACNTAHLLIDKLQLLTDTKFVSMIDEVMKFVNIKRHQRIGLLATPTTYRTLLYQNAFTTNGVNVLIPENKDIKKLGHIVNDIIKGEFTYKSLEVKKIADKLVAQGAQAIILGCTELPLISPKKYKVPVISSLDLLANSVLKQYYSS